MRQRILDLLAAGKTYSQIVAEVGCSKSTVSYHAKNVKEPPNYKVHDWTAVQSYYDAGHGANACRRWFHICTTTWYSAVKTGKVTTRADHRISIEALTARERNTPRSHLRWRLIADGVLDQVCAECGTIAWRGKPLSMHLHHINGVKNDNQLENLQMLCPNCHSQTASFSGRNNKR